MNYQRMEEIIEKVYGDIKKLRETKGREYAQDEDTLADFKEVAVEAGITPLQCWATYVKKHQRAIDTFVREGGVKSESIESRVIDVIVYHFLLLGLIEDLDPLKMEPYPVPYAMARRPTPEAILKQFHWEEANDTTARQASDRLREFGYRGTAVWEVGVEGLAGAGETFLRYRPDPARPDAPNELITDDDPAGRVSPGGKGELAWTARG